MQDIQLKFFYNNIAFLSNDRILCYMQDVKKICKRVKYE